MSIHCCEEMLGVFLLIVLGISVAYYYTCSKGWIFDSCNTQRGDRNLFSWEDKVNKFTIFNFQLNQLHASFSIFDWTMAIWSILNLFTVHRKSFNYIARNTEVQAKDYKWLLPLNKLGITTMPLGKCGKYARDWTLTAKTVWWDILVKI